MKQIILNCENEQSMSCDDLPQESSIMGKNEGKSPIGPMIDKNKKINEKKNIGVINEKMCKFCKKEYSRKDNRCRHMKKCKQRDKYYEMIEVKYEYVEKERDLYKNGSDMFESIAKMQIKMSKMKEIAMKYPDAEPLKLLDYSDYLNNTNYKLDKSRPYQDFEEQFLEEILSSHNKKSSHVTVGEAIINLYVTENEKDRSLWCTDISRLKYMVMKLNTENKAEWISDPKGKYIQSQIIDPIINKIKTLLKMYKDGYYIKKHKKNGIDISNEYIDKYMKYIESAHDLLDRIERKKFQSKLLRYLSKHFSIIKEVTIDNII